MNDEIIIALATDENCVMPTTVTLESMKKNKNTESKYKIFIFADEISQQSFEILLNMAKENFEINIININNQYKSIKVLGCPHVSSATFLRLDIPYYLKNYSKVLYIDIDTIILKDLSELYNVDLKNYYAGVVKGITKLRGCYTDYFKEILNIKNNNVFNAGIMLFNIPKYTEKSDFNKKLMSLYNKDMLFGDQDILNVGFKEKVLYLSPKYNFYSLLAYFTKNKISKCYNCSKQEIKKNNITIIHYITERKPWSYSFVPLSNIWMKYYRETVFGKNKLKLKNGFYWNLYFTIIYKLNLLKLDAIFRKIKHKIQKKK